MLRVAVIGADPATRAGLVRPDATWVAEFRSTLPRCEARPDSWPALVMVVLDGAIPDVDMKAWLAQARVARRAVPVLLLARLTANHVHRTVELTRAGASAVVLRGIDDANLAICNALRPLKLPGRVAVELAKYPWPLPDALRAALEHCLECFDAGHELDRKALSALIRPLSSHRVSRGVGVLRVGGLVRWCRFMAAAHALDRGHSVDDAARAARCCDAAALRHGLARYALPSPKGLRQGCAVEVVVRAFLQLCGTALIISPDTPQAGALA